MKRIHVCSLGPLAEADVSFGDMTILVGPQASGKSIFLQTVKLVLDHGEIARNIKTYGFDWQGEKDHFLSLYFGEGMQGLWQDSTSISSDGHSFDLEEALSKRGPKRPESLFLVPAQRVLTLSNGWPRPFTDFAAGDPYVVKQFSEHLRQLMEAGLGSGQGSIFPQERRLISDVRNAIEDSIFHGAELKLDTVSVRKRFVLDVSGYQLPFMTWSAGQREFIPLLLGLYWLMPPSRVAKRKDFEWVVIEEPEAGLHPRAITAVLVTLLELMHRGYKVIVSTHSPVTLELAWAIRELAERSVEPECLLELLALPRSKQLIDRAREILTERVFKTYYFARRNGTFCAKDISTLDPGSMDDAIADWGGLTSFSTRASRVVSKAAQEHP